MLFSLFSQQSKAANKKKMPELTQGLLDGQEQAVEFQEAKRGRWSLS